MSDNAQELAKTYLLTWNPEKRPWDNLAELSEQVKSGMEVERRWNCRSEKVKLGDRVFLLKQGSEPRGIFASGVCVKEPYKDKHYDPEKDKEISYIRFKLDSLLDPEVDLIFPVSESIPSNLWGNQTSGISLPEEIAQELEEKWRGFLSQFNMGYSQEDNFNQNGAGYGDAKNNAIVEQAAIDAVTKMYQEQGWNVQSVERDRCGYDLICTRGQERDDVEVKGVSSLLCNFILTYGELDQAKTNMNFVLCVVTKANSEPVINQFTGAEFLTKFEIKPVQYRAIMK